MELWQLKQRQQLPLELKVKLTQERIKEWYNYHNGEVFVSFSGGKDSTVLLHLIRQLYPEVTAVFVDTGLEYPEIRQFVKTFDNVVMLKPTISFKEVLEKYGYPVVSKKVARQIRTLQNPTDDNIKTTNLTLTGITSDGTFAPSFKIAKKWLYLKDAPFKISDRCCDVMKKQPIYKYEHSSHKKGYVGTMASDSRLRERAYLKTGCNNFNGGKSTPISFWFEKDIWEYIQQNKIPYCSVYDTGVTNTGCVFCMFGVHLEKEPNRFQCMKVSHPTLYKYCMEKLGLKEILKYIGVKYNTSQRKLW